MLDREFCNRGVSHLKPLVLYYYRNKQTELFYNSVQDFKFENFVLNDKIITQGVKYE